MSRRKQNLSMSNFNKLQIDNQNNSGLPDVVKQPPVQSPDNHPKMIGTYFNSMRHSIAKSSKTGSLSQTPSAQNVPMKADQALFSRKNIDEITKNAEHLDLLRKLESFIQLKKVKPMKVPEDLESTHQLDSFIDSITVILTAKEFESIKIETLNLATGIRTDYCEYILEKVKELRLREIKYEEMYLCLKDITDKFILSETHFNQKKSELLEYKQETERLCIEKYELKKRCDSLKSENRELVVQQTELNDKISNLKKKISEK